MPNSPASTKTTAIAFEEFRLPHVGPWVKLEAADYQCKHHQQGHEDNYFLHCAVTSQPNVGTGPA